MAAVRNFGYFPFCPVSADGYDTGPYTYYPIGIPLEQAIEWFWLPKTFRANLNLFDSFEVDFPSNAKINSENGEDDFIPADERYLVCGGTDIELGGIQLGDNVLDQFNFSLFADSFGEPPLLVEGNTYYPRLEFFSNYQGNAISTIEFFESTEGGTFTFLGENIPTLRSNVESFFPSCTIEAFDYWEYDPNDGLGPIRNSSNGSLIRQPSTWNYN